MITAPTRRIALAIAAAALAIVALPLTARAATYDPLNVIPYETFRGASSMNAADIQAFLSTQAGPLKSLVTTDYVDPQTGTAWRAGMPSKSAAQIICEAAKRWNLNPRVIIATLQKEQSLITTSNSSNAKRLKKAMGAGVYGDANHDGITDNRYPGFGNQVWNGARMLSTYETTYGWYSGKPKAVTAYKSVEATKTVSGKVVTYTKTVSYTKYIVPANASTFALYTYTPYYPQINVWTIYVRYFGDPKTPPRMRPVYRFRSRSNGTYYYTASEAKRYTLIRTSSSRWSFEGGTFTIDASATANSVPVYQMYNTRTHRFLYTTSAAKKASLLAVRPSQWRCDGTAFRVSTAVSSQVPVYKLERKTDHGIVYTSSASTVKKVTTGSRPPFWNRGVAFRIALSVESTVPVGPSSN